MTATCAACGADRPLAELIRVTAIPAGTVTYVCRPSQPPPGRYAGACFRVAVPIRARATIALATDPREVTA